MPEARFCLVNNLLEDRCSVERIYGSQVFGNAVVHYARCESCEHIDVTLKLLYKL
jgi:hypothetical protein